MDVPLREVKVKVSQRGSRSLDVVLVFAFSRGSLLTSDGLLLSGERVLQGQLTSCVYSELFASCLRPLHGSLVPGDSISAPVACVMQCRPCREDY